MRRATRLFLAFLSTISLLACAGICTLWARSYVDAESFSYTKRADAPGRLWQRVLLVSSDRGLMGFAVVIGDRKWDLDGDSKPPRIEPGFGHWLKQSGRVMGLRVDQAPGEPLLARLGFRRGDQVDQNATMRISYRRYAWPYWFAALLTVPLPALQLFAWRRRRMSRRWQMAGRCAACGYDLRFTAGRCSECGAMMPFGFGPGMSIRRVVRAFVLASALIAVLFGGLWLRREWVRRHTDPLAPIARFSFDKNDDASGFGARMERKNVPIENGALAINGVYANGATREAGYRAVVDVPQLDYNAFTVIWRFKCAQTMASGRSNLLTGGTSYRWLCVSRAASGRMNIDFNNGDTAAQDIDGTEIKPGRWYQAAVSVDVKLRRGFVMLDGQKVADLKLPPDFKLSVVGLDVDRSDRAFTFTNYSNGETFAGQVDEIIVFPRALAERDLAPYWRVEATPASTMPSASPQR